MRYLKGPVDDEGTARFAMDLPQQEEDVIRTLYLANYVFETTDGTFLMVLDVVTAP